MPVTPLGPRPSPLGRVSDTNRGGDRAADSSSGPVRDTGVVRPSVARALLPHRAGEEAAVADSESVALAGPPASSRCLGLTVTVG